MPEFVAVAGGMAKIVDVRGPNTLVNSKAVDSDTYPDTSDLLIVVFSLERK